MFEAVGFQQDNICHRLGLAIGLVILVCWLVEATWMDSDLQCSVMVLSFNPGRAFLFFAICVFLGGSILGEREFITCCHNCPWSMLKPEGWDSSVKISTCNIGDKENIHDVHSANMMHVNTFPFRRHSWIWWVINTPSVWMLRILKAQDKKQWKVCPEQEYGGGGGGGEN